MRGEGRAVCKHVKVWWEGRAFVLVAVGEDT